MACALVWLSAARGLFDNCLQAQLDPT